MAAESFAIIDFETSGLSPDMGNRATEVAAVKVVDGVAVARYQSLMNSGEWISSRITEITGITNEMLEDAPDSDQVMEELVDFLESDYLVAHNASFDKKFLQNELLLAGIKRRFDFTCSMNVARRVFPAAPNHKLETLIAYRNLAKGERFHRALADANATWRLWEDMSRAAGKKKEAAPLTFQQMKSLYC
jgi:DNA polymerase-3 subunit epsilon